jgi:cytochrome c biogenesis protein CcmG, thiol:disulfide interchange protein DsbE
MLRQPGGRLKLAARCFAVLLALLPVSAVHAADAGKPAPDIVVHAADGSTQKLSALRGKIVYVDFWASWCIPCRESFPWMNEMHRKYAARDLVVLAVNLDAKRTDADAFLARYPAQFRVVYDAESGTAKEFGVKAMPTSFLVGRDGTLLYEHRGFKESQTAPVEAEIERAITTK